MTPIAVVGIDCRFPGVRDKFEFWRLLISGSVTDTEAPSPRWDVSASCRPDGDAVGYEFFGIAPAGAAALDPQQRLLRESAWRAVEDAGVDPRSLPGTPTGVFVGIMSSERTNQRTLDYARGTALSTTGSGYLLAANRVSYHLGLAGPSVAIDSACSSSLVAVHQGCAALRFGDADTVIASGVNLIRTPQRSVVCTQTGPSVPDRGSFRQSADGRGRGEGVGTVVLRRLEDAIAEGQPVYAVIRSSATNQGARRNGTTVPDRSSPAALMRRTLGRADVEPHQVSFIEAHGPADAFGDVYKGRREPCVLGSVKGNIGHTQGGAGIAAFIKACMALHLGIVPPTVFGDSADPALHPEEHGLAPATDPYRLPAHGAVGVVSSFGLGGSNAQVVLGAAPSPRADVLRRNSVAPTQPDHLVLTGNRDSSAHGPQGGETR